MTPRSATGCLRYAGALSSCTFRPTISATWSKKETGKSAQEYIQLKVIDIAKERMFDTTKSISEIAYELGFRYPQHFTRLFKKCVGQSPNEYPDTKLTRRHGRQKEADGKNGENRREGRT